MNIIATLKSQIRKLDAQAASIAQKKERLQSAIDALGGKSPVTAKPATAKKRTMSAAGRRRIAAAQQARWAKLKKGKAAAAGKPAKKKRRISSAGRKAMAAAAKARWAKVKAAKK